MKILVLRHEIFEDLGFIADTFDAENVSLHYPDFSEHAEIAQSHSREEISYRQVSVRPSNGADASLPSASGAYAGAASLAGNDSLVSHYDALVSQNDALVVLGGPMSANDPSPMLIREVKMIERALKRRMPILGICLGAQLIAKALGARVYRNAELEIGWEPVYFTEAGKCDPLFRDLASPTTFFHWHGETFDLPNGAEWLAYSEKTRHQAYRFGENVYGLQFHPEVTTAMAADWQTQPVNCADVATLGALIDPHAHDQSKLAARIARAFVALVRDSGVEARNPEVRTQKSE